jgi:hypothetical protein
MAAGSVGKGTLEAHCRGRLGRPAHGRRGSARGVGLRELVMKPLTFRLHREWHRPKKLWRALGGSTVYIVALRLGVDRYLDAVRALGILA